MTVATPAAIHAIGRQYKVSQVYGHADGTCSCFIIEPETGMNIPIVWSYLEDIRQKTEAQKIDFVRALLRNAIDSLDFAMQERGGLQYNEEVEETVFD
jgi:hypothetical protein